MKVEFEIPDNAVFYGKKVIKYSAFLISLFVFYKIHRHISPEITIFFALHCLLLPVLILIFNIVCMTQAQSKKIWYVFPTVISVLFMLDNILFLYNNLTKLSDIPPNMIRAGMEFSVCLIIPLIGSKLYQSYKTRTIK